MATRFRKTKTIASGVKLNIGKKGLSTTLGGKGHSLSVGKNGVYGNVGVPGTGLSYRTRLAGGSNKSTTPSLYNSNSFLSWIFWIAAVFLIWGLGSLLISDDKLFAFCMIAVSVAIMIACNYFFKRKYKKVKAENE